MNGHEMTLDGYLDCEIVTDGGPGTPIRFRLICSATDEAVDELIMPCSVTDPVMARDLCQLMVGDHLRVTGCLHLPQQPDAPVWLAVARVELLHTAPLLDPTNADTDQLDLPAAEPSPEDTEDTEDTAVPLIDRYADYLAVHDPAGGTHIWHTSGTTVGVAENPDEIGDLIAAYEHRTGHGET